MSADCFNKTKSSQPHLLFLPVTVPNSFPINPEEPNIEKGQGRVPMAPLHVLGP